jgi:hypothetical protein
MATAEAGPPVTSDLAAEEPMPANESCMESGGFHVGTR